MWTGPAVRSGSQVLSVRSGSVRFTNITVPSIPVHNFYRFGPVHELLEYEDKDFPTVNSIFSSLFHRCHRFGPVRFTRLTGPVRFDSHILQIRSSAIHTFDRSGWIHNFYRSGPVRQPFTNGIFSPFRTVTTFTQHMKKSFRESWKDPLNFIWV